MPMGRVAALAAAAEEEDTDLESVATLSSTNSATRAERLAQAVASELQGTCAVRRPSKTVINPQLLSPPLFAPWSQVASLRGVVAVHKDSEACPHEELTVALDFFARVEALCVQVMHKSP